MSGDNDNDNDHNNNDNNADNTSDQWSSNTPRSGESRKASGNWGKTHLAASASGRIRHARPLCRWTGANRRSRVRREMTSISFLTSLGGMTSSPMRSSCDKGFS